MIDADHDELRASYGMLAARSDEAHMSNCTRFELLTFARRKL